MRMGRLLEAGAQGIMYPRCESAEEAAEARSLGQVRAAGRARRGWRQWRQPLLRDADAPVFEGGQRAHAADRPTRIATCSRPGRGNRPGARHRCFDAGARRSQRGRGNSLSVRSPFDRRRLSTRGRGGQRSPENGGEPSAAVPNTRQMLLELGAKFICHGCDLDHGQAGDGTDSAALRAAWFHVRRTASPPKRPNSYRLIIGSWDTSIMQADCSNPRFERDGFVVIRELLPSAEMAQLRQNLDRYIRDVVPGLPDADAFYDDRERPETLKQLQRMGRDSYFEAYRGHPRWVDLAADAAGRAGGRRASRNGSTSRPARITSRRRIRTITISACTPPRVLTIWLALDDVDAENGCLRYVAGSHQRGYRTHARSSILGFSQGIIDYGPDDFTREVAVTLRRGRRGRPSRHDDPPRGCQSVRHPPSPLVRDGVQGGLVPARRGRLFERYLASARQQHQELGLKT